jgi:hypothetical protein
MGAPNVSAPTPVVFAPSLAWLVGRAVLDDDALVAARAVHPETVADGASDPALLVSALQHGGQGAAACRLLACALPPREGVWWGWTAARHALQLPGQPVPAPAAVQALAAVEQWIAAPDDEHRRAAWAAAEKAGMDSPAGSAAGAVFFISGSVAPADIPVVPPPPGIHCTLAGTAVVMAAASDPANFNALLDVYVQQALGIVAHLGGWDTTLQLSRQHFDVQREQHDAVLAAARPAPAPSSTGGS